MINHLPELEVGDTVRFSSGWVFIEDYNSLLIPVLGGYSENNGYPKDEGTFLGLDSKGWLKIQWREHVIRLAVTHYKDGAYSIVYKPVTDESYSID